MYALQPQQNFAASACAHTVQGLVSGALSVTADDPLRTLRPPGTFSRMGGETRQRWIEAGIALGTDAKAAVRCPACGSPNLIVRDVAYEADEKGRFDRYLQCAKCGANEVLSRMRPAT